jgi:H+/Na+-translocating ferredoxin:NAD+ oxidoreductase subunit D
MSQLAKTLEIRTSPHLVSGTSVRTIMANVIAALVPASAFAIYAFGIGAVLVLGVAIASCLAAEAGVARLAGRRSTLGDLSAALTGLLYGLTLPPGLPLWIVAVGGLAAIVVGKALFGGLGANPFNPALVGRAILQAAFPVPMTSWLAPFAADRFSAAPSTLWTPPFAAPLYDAVAGATPLSLWKFSHQATGARELALGFVSGSVGETSALLVVAGGVYLLARNLMSWRIPAALLGTVAVLAVVLHAVHPARYPTVEFTLLSGGLLLGALFMATDPVTCPITHGGSLLFGVLVGTLVIVIRYWGGMPEGVMYAVLLGNAAAPHLDQWAQPRVYGTRKAPAT